MHEQRESKTSTQTAQSPRAAESAKGARPSLRGLPFAEQEARLRPSNGAVQGKGSPSGADIHGAAQRGVEGGGGPLPFLEQIQASFGRHDVTQVKAHQGEAAKRAGESMGASAYAMGGDVAFADAPSLHTAAHEAAHVVQQRAGVSLEGGVGKAGDRYERAADQVADRVVRGESAEALLSGGGGRGAAVQRSQPRAIQRAPKKKAKSAKSGAEQPHPDDLALAVSYDLGSGTPRDVCQSYVGRLKDAASAMQSSQISAIQNFETFMGSASAAEAEPDVVGAIITAVVEQVSESVLGKLKDLGGTLVGAIAGFEAAPTIPEKEDGASKAEAPKTETRPAATPKPATAATSEEKPQASAPEAAEKAPAPPSSAEVKKAAEAAYGSFSKLASAANSELKRAAKAKDEVSMRDFLVKMRDALADSYKSSLESLNGDLVHQLDKAVLKLGASMNPQIAWRQPQATCFGPQAAFLEVLDQSGERTLSAVPSSTEVLHDIVGRWLSERQGGGVIEVHIDLETRQVTSASFVGAKGGQISDMLNKIMKGTGRDITELGVPVVIVAKAPGVGGGAKEHRVPYGGPEAFDGWPTGMSPAGVGKWRNFPSHLLRQPTIK